MLVNTRTGETGVAAAACRVNHDLRASTPVLMTETAAATTHSIHGDLVWNRTFVRDRFGLGWHPSAIVEALPGFDPFHHQERQYGLVDLRQGGRAATFSGSQLVGWAGGVTGRVEVSGHADAEIVYAIQGFGLTGAAVVDAAEAAVRNTQGDLATRLMASMEAARSMGGVRSCSCPGVPQEQCGSPPASFTRTSYSAFMLIARPGDRDGCSLTYYLAHRPQRVIVADLDLDGFPEILSCNRSAPIGAVVLRNVSDVVGQSAFSNRQTYIINWNPSDLFVADVTEDNIPDALIALAGNNRILLLRGGRNAQGEATGLLGVPTLLASGSEPRGVVAADFNLDGILDVASCNRGDSTLSTFRGAGGGAFWLATNIPVIQSPTTIALGDFDGDGDMDIVLGSELAAGVQIVRNHSSAGGPIVFVAEPAIAGIGSRVAQVDVGDLNNDGLPDIVAASEVGSSISTIFNTGAGFAVQSISFGPVPKGVAIGDVNGDGLTDIVAAAGLYNASRVGVFLGQGDGTFDSTPILLPLPGTPGRIGLADIDVDGDLDLVAAEADLHYAVVLPNIGGASIFSDGVGCATGEFYLELNVIGADAFAPDAVSQLQMQYDAWRSALIGRPDAEQSSAVLSAPRAAMGAMGPCEQTLTIRLRDWQGNDVVVAPERVSVSHAAASPMRASVSAATPQPDASLTFTITSPFPLPTDEDGDQLLVHVFPEGEATPTNRTVTLMPKVRLARVPHADFDLDAETTISDVFAMLLAWFAREDSGDYNRTGMHEESDIIEFVSAWFAAQ